jgi:hypothetical protein
MKFNRLLSFFMGLGLCACSGNMQIKSPDGEISVKVEIKENGIAQYQVNAYGQDILDTSELGLIAQETNLHNGFKVRKVRRDKVDQKWSQPWGENKQMRDKHHEMAVEMKNAEGVELTLRFRAFDDGIGYRYEYDATAAGVDSLTIIGDRTYFNFAQDGTCWSIGSYFSGYELPYREQADEGYLKELTAGLLELGPKAVIITGLLWEENTTGFAAGDRDGLRCYQAQRIPRSQHGTGDMFAAVFTGALVKGRNSYDAAALAARFVERVVAATPQSTPFGAEFETQLPWLWEQL